MNHLSITMNRTLHYLKAFLLITVLVITACKKDKNKQADEPESPKPLADFTYQKGGPDDPFTFTFTNKSADFKEIRWEFGDDTTTTTVSPVHTYINPGTYRIKMIARNDQGYWAQKETKIVLNADSILNFGSSKGGNGKIRLSLTGPLKTSSIAWYKGFGSGAKLVEKAPETLVAIPDNDYETYSVRVMTPKGSKVEVYRLVGSAGVLKDITASGALSVSRDNDNGPASGEGSLKLIDNNLISKFLQFNYNGTLWAELDFKNNPVAIGAYSITSGNDEPGRDPKNFNIEASNDRQNWTRLHEVTNAIFALRTLTRTFVFVNTTAYRYYRLNVTAINGAGLIQVAEWRCFTVQP